MKKLKVSSLIGGILLFSSLFNYVYAQDNVEIKEISGTSIIKEGWQNQIETVIILNSKAVIDGIVATPLASIYDAPILLTEIDGLSAEMQTELKRLNPSNIIIIGGDSVVSNEAIEDIKNTIPNASIERLNGLDRYETSLMVIKKIYERVSFTEAFVVSGNSQADLLSVAGKAGEDKIPIILTSKDSIPESIYNWLKETKLKNAYFIGGEAVISNNVINSVNNITYNDINNNRVFGQDRFETNAKVIEKFYSNDNLESVSIIDVNDYTNGLIVAPFSAKYKSPMVIVSDKLNRTQSDVLKLKYTDKVYRIGNRVNDNAFDEFMLKLIYKGNVNSKDVLFFVPHQDDEMLSFSTTIKKYINMGYNVNVILSTDGSGEGGTRKILNGESGKPCKIHKYVHNPKKENYKINNQNVSYITPEILSQYRSDEYVNALLALGVKKENIHLSNYIARDGLLTKDVAIKIIMEYIKKYPTATVHTFYGNSFSINNHNDHMNLGKGAVELFDRGIIEKLYLHVEPYLYDEFSKRGLAKDVIIDKPTSTSDKETIVKAMKQYNVWDPKNGKLAIGYHSVKPYFDSGMKNLTNYSVKYIANY